MNSDSFEQLWAEQVRSFPALGMFVYILLSALFLRVLGFNRGMGMELRDEE